MNDMDKWDKHIQEQIEGTKRRATHIRAEATVDKLEIEPTWRQRLKNKNRDLQEQIATLQAEAAILRGALEFYADERQYNIMRVTKWHEEKMLVWFDAGQKAQQALQSTTTGQELLERLRLAGEVVEAARNVCKKTTFTSPAPSVETLVLNIQKTYRMLAVPLEAYDRHVEPE